MSNVKSHLAKGSLWQYFKSVYRIHFLKRPLAAKAIFCVSALLLTFSCLFYSWTTTKTPALQCTAVGCKHSAELVLTVPALHTLSKVVRWIPWRRHWRWFMFAAIPMSNGTGVHPFPSWDGHTQQVSDHRLSMALPWALAGSQMRHWAHPYSPSRARSWNMWDERLERDLASSQDMHWREQDCFVHCSALSWALCPCEHLCRSLLCLSPLPPALTLQAHWYSLLLEQVLVLLLLLLPVGLNRVLGKELHQLQGLFDLQQHFVGLPSPHLGHRKRTGIGGKGKF